MLGVKDASGNFILVNPLPGQFGTLAHNYLTGPGFFRLDLNVLKRIKIREGKELILRADAVNATNTPAFSAPNTFINSPTFGRINSVLPNSNRVIAISARFEF